MREFLAQFRTGICTMCFSGSFVIEHHAPKQNHAYMYVVVEEVTCVTLSPHRDELKSHVTLIQTEIHPVIKFGVKII